ANPKAGGILGSIAKICPAGQGFNVTRFYDQPPRYPDSQFNQQYFATLCQRLDAAHQASGMFDFILEYSNRTEAEQGAGMFFLRQLLWVN
ncbi:MAG: hypothetical protein V4463_00980, partial [Pseudomonadota bacterium]